MTTFEHAAVGATAVLATGLHRRFGWQLAAVAAGAAISPDWDGIAILFSLEWFDRMHRVWGHNVWVSAAVGVLLAAADYRWQLASLGHRWLEWALDNRTLPALGVGRPRSHLGVWLAVGCVGAWSHLPADMAFSGNADFGDWPLRLWWPFSDRAYSFPLVPWGDVGVSVIFALGIIAMLRWRMRVQLLSAITLATVLVYIVCRGPVGNTLMLN